jgi:hypothetical protein
MRQTNSEKSDHMGSQVKVEKGLTMQTVNTWYGNGK